MIIQLGGVYTTAEGWTVPNMVTQCLWDNTQMCTQYSMRHRKTCGNLVTVMGKVTQESQKMSECENLQMMWRQGRSHGG